MRFMILLILLPGCSVFRDAREELQKDVTGMQAEFARLYVKEKSQ